MASPGRRAAAATHCQSASAARRSTRASDSPSLKGMSPNSSTSAMTDGFLLRSQSLTARKESSAHSSLRTGSASTAAPASRADSSSPMASTKPSRHATVTWAVAFLMPCR